MHLGSVADAVGHVKHNGTDIFHTQVTRAANKGGTSKGWRFSFEGEIPHPPLVANAPPSSAPAVVSSFFRPISSLPTCACCGDKLLGDIVTCTNCHHKVHVLCTQHGHSFKCVCRLCNQPPGLDMRACKTCKHLVHTTCALHVSFRVEVVCKVCTPRLREHPPPAKREKRRFRTEWQAGRPWLQHANGVMWCAACREYPRPGVQQCWVTMMMVQRSRNQPDVALAGLLMQLRAEVLGYSVVVPVHGNCHRADLAFQDAMDSNHVFLDIVSEVMTSVTGWFKNAPTWLRTLRTMAIGMDMSPLRYGCLSQRRWAAFAARAVRALLRTYATMVCTLFVARPSRKHDKEQRQQLLMMVTNFFFVASLHFLQDFTHVYHSYVWVNGGCRM